MDIRDVITASIEVKRRILADKDFVCRIGKVAELCTKALQCGGKIWFCGNGGSAADAQHLAAELSGRFYMDRKPLPAEALHVNTSFLTAVANDYGYEQTYARMICGSARKGDVLFAISTSGNSLNILKAIEQANAMGVSVIGFTGESGGKMKDCCDVLLNVPSTDTPRIQEAHIMIGHVVCEMIENNLFQ